jgi:hypothetical protein
MKDFDQGFAATESGGHNGSRRRGLSLGPATRALVAADNSTWLGVTRVTPMLGAA